MYKLPPTLLNWALSKFTAQCESGPLSNTVLKVQCDLPAKLLVGNELARFDRQEILVVCHSNCVCNHARKLDQLV